VAPGQYFLIGVVDKEEVVEESDETNNQEIKPVIVARTTGIIDGSLDLLFSVYPVPATDWLAVDLTMNPGENTEISITNILGSRVYWHTFVSGMRDHFEIDVTNWQKGVYLIMCETEGSRMIRKILVE
jgi:hypothetical protein